MSENLSWCFGIENGLKMIEPNKRLSKSYFARAKNSLERAEKNFEDGDLLWTTVVAYYAEYYALYSFLQRIGVKCENHSCSIEAISQLLSEEKVEPIRRHKKKRVDAQYYMEVGKEQEVKDMLKEAKKFVSGFDIIISDTKKEDVEKYREMLSEYK